MLAAHVRGLCAGISLFEDPTICCSVKRDFFTVRLPSRLAQEFSTYDWCTFAGQRQVPEMLPPLRRAMPRARSSPKSDGMAGDALTAQHFRLRPSP